MYAIIESCGKQYKVSEGDMVFFEKLDAEVGKKVTFSNVILVSDDKKVEVGTPYVKDVTVEGKVAEHGKGKKIIVYKYKAKKNYRRTQGHRQPYTKVEITKIALATKKAESAPKAEAEEKKETVAKAQATKTTTATKSQATKTTTAKKTTTTKATTKTTATKKAEENA